VDLVYQVSLLPLPFIRDGGDGLALTAAIETLPPSAFAPTNATLFQFSGAKPQWVFVVSIEIPVITAVVTVNPIHLAVASLTGWLSHHFSSSRSSGTATACFP
jgi:hypothetical protein